MVGTFIGRVAQRVTQATCRHDYHWAFGDKRTYLRCAKCNHETQGWDVRNEKPPKHKFDGDPDRHRTK